MAAHVLTYRLPLIDANGDPVNGGSIEFYEPGGSSTPKAVYSDKSLSTSAGTSVDTNSLGMPENSGVAITVYGDGAYYVIFKDAAGVQVDAFEWVSEADSTLTNIAALKLLAGGYNGQLIRVKGYYAAGDGGGGEFYWDATSTETDNGGTIFQVTGVTTGRWKRSGIYTFNGFNVLWFGAYRDNTNAATTRASINSTISYASALKASVIMPAGVYAVDAPVEGLMYVSLIGEGSGHIEASGGSPTALTGGGTEIRPATGFTGTHVLKYTGTFSPSNWTGWFNVRDIHICNKNELTGFGGIEILGAVWEWGLENVKVSFTKNEGLHLDRCYRGVINNIGIYNCALSGGAAIELDDTSGVDKCNVLTFIGGNIQSTPASQYALSLDTVGTTTFYGTTFQSNGYGVSLIDTNNITFVGCYMEDTDREFVTSSGSATNTNLRVLNCAIAKSTYTNAVILNDDEDAVFDQLVVNQSAKATITKNSGSVRSKIINSPYVTYTSGATKGSVDIEDDFYSTALDTNKWTLTTGATGSGAIVNLDNGVYRLASGTTAASNAYITLGTNPLIYASDNPVIEVRAKVNAVTQNTIRMLTLENGANWIRFYANNAGSATNVTCETYDGTATTQSSSLVIDTNYHVYKMVITSSAVEFYIDGVLERTITTNIPTVVLDLSLYIATSDTSDKQLDIDYVRVSKDNV